MMTKYVKARRKCNNVYVQSCANLCSIPWLCKYVLLHKAVLATYKPLACLCFARGRGLHPPHEVLTMGGTVIYKFI